MENWRPRSVREGIRQADGPYDGIPAHIEAAVQHWVMTHFGWFVKGGGLSRDFIMKAASLARIPFGYSHDAARMSDQVIRNCQASHEKYLDLVDAVLHLTKGSRADVLRGILQDGASLWTVAPDGLQLQRRVDGTASRAFDLATSPNDLSSEELKEAWGKVFSRDPDASDAWDHAAKAVEAILIPIVVPSQAKPHLGHVLGQLRAHSDQWKLLLPGAQGNHSVEPLIQMLDLLWPNPDRHASQERRTPSLEEAQAVVVLATTIVQWIRTNVLAPRSGCDRHTV